MEQILKAFHHLAREIQIYFLSGILLIGEGIIIDHVYRQKAILKCLSRWWEGFPIVVIITVILFAYILGHLAHAVIYCLLEFLGFEKWIKKWIKRRFCSCSVKDEKELCEKELTRREIAIFSKSPDLHDKFVERYSVLNLMRWTLSGTNLISSLVSLILLIATGCDLPKMIVLIIYSSSFIFLYLLSLKTEEDMYTRISLTWEMKDAMEKDQVAEKD